MKSKSKGRLPQKGVPEKSSVAYAVVFEGRFKNKVGEMEIYPYLYV
jgi:hypothetical protein